MGIVKKSGHAVTSVLPSNSDVSSVGKVNLQFRKAPGNQSGGEGSKRAKTVNPTGRGNNLNKK
jgi:hypothetical protein